MKHLLSLAVFALSFLNINAQSGQTSVQWRDKPALSKIDSRYDNETAVFVVDNRTIVFRDNAQQDVEQVKTIHRIIRVNNDQGIERFNKVYLPGGKSNQTLQFKARSILPDGKVMLVDSSSLKDYTDEEGDEYKIFAVPGLVKGAEIEYTYSWLKSDFSYFGTEVIQQGVPVLNSQILIECPARLIFDGKCFNGKVVSNDTLLAETRYKSFSFSDIAAADDEKYANLSAQLLRLEYKLSYNKANNNGARLFTWNEFAKRVFANYSNYSDKEKKRIEDLVDQLKLAKMTSTDQKVKAIENYIKLNIMVRNDLNNESNASVDLILKNRIASDLGMVRLFGAALQEAGIEHQFVLSGDRTHYEIDKTFENWNNANKPIILIVESGQYLAPTRQDLRYPWVAPEWCMTPGVHLKTTSLGTLKTAMADIRVIPMPSFDKSYSNLDARIVIVPEKDSLLVEMKQSFLGFSAIPYRAAFSFGDADNQKEIIKEMVKSGTNSERILSSRVANQDLESQQSDKPFVLEASVRADKLMEKAGQKILLKIGEIIGQQVELYQEKERIFPIDVSYPHALNRNIRVELPAGYRIKNLDGLSISQVFPSKEAPEMQFTSSHKMEGNTLVITVTEEYRNTRYPISSFEDFRKVINASADFNKIVLVLDPIK